MLGYAVALAIGLLVGLEREWHHRDQPSVVAGSRTFATFALAGAVAADLGSTVVAAGVLGVAVLATAGYLRSRDPDVGLTTEAAALATYLLGALTMSHATVAAAVAVTLTALLTAKERLHHFARSVISETEVDDTLLLFVAAFVVLPILPGGAHGPYGVLDLRRIWTLVVLITAVGWAGYVAARALGPERGLEVAGLAGGFVSGAATTAALARAARDTQATAAHLGGALLTSVATLVQLVVVVAAANRALLRQVVPAAVAGVVVLFAEVVLLKRSRTASTESAEVTGSRPFRLAPALVLAAILTAVLLVSRWSTGRFGSAGSVVTAGFAGLADTHATAGATAALVRHGALDAATGVAAIGAALAMNTVTKVTVAFAGGGRPFGLRYLGLMLGPMLAVAGALVLVGR